MKNRRCPSHKACLDYDNGNCENCVFGEKIIKLHKRIDRLKKQNETLTIQRNVWALTAKAVKADTVKKIQDIIAARFAVSKVHYMRDEGITTTYELTNWQLDQIAKEILEGTK